jgi:hypothetical protein
MPPGGAKQQSREQKPTKDRRLQRVAGSVSEQRKGSGYPS